MPVRSHFHRVCSFPHLRIDVSHHYRAVVWSKGLNLTNSNHSTTMPNMIRIAYDILKLRYPEYYNIGLTVKHCSGKQNYHIGLLLI